MLPLNERGARGHSGPSGVAIPLTPNASGRVSHARFQVITFDLERRDRRSDPRRYSGCEIPDLDAAEGVLGFGAGVGGVGHVVTNA